MHGAGRALGDKGEWTRAPPKRRTQTDASLYNTANGKTHGQDTTAATAPEPRDLMSMRQQWLTGRFMAPIKS